MQHAPDAMKVRYSDILFLGESHQRTEPLDGRVVMETMPDFEHQYEIF
jgi:hypothetical protein